MNNCSTFWHTYADSKISASLYKNSDVIEIPVLINEKLPTEMLETIFSHLPPTDMIKKCSLVCRDWSEIVRNQRFWLKLCTENGVAIPPPSLRADHEFDYQRLRVRQPLGRNLIINGSGETGTIDPWSEFPGQTIESPPVGCENSTTKTCFATKLFVLRRQFYKLADLGITAALIKHGRLRVTFTEKCAARAGSTAHYILTGCLSIHPIDRCMSEGRVFENILNRPVWQTATVSFNLPEKYPEIGFVIFYTTTRSHPGQPEGFYSAKTCDATMTIESDAWKEPIGEDVRVHYGTHNWEAEI